MNAASGGGGSGGSGRAGQVVVYVK
jgi:hypothetical protein